MGGGFGLMSEKLQGFDLIAKESKRHVNEGPFVMDCPFCDAVNRLEMISTVYSAAGRCIACRMPVHIKWDYDENGE